MSDDNVPPDQELRKRANERIAGSKAPSAKMTKQDVSKLVEELRVHQAELEIQNEELHRTQTELETSRAKYFDLYNLAPVGYITLGTDLMIKEVNLTAASLLGQERRDLVNYPLSAFIFPESMESYYSHYDQVARGSDKRRTVLKLQRKDRTHIDVQVETVRDEKPSEGFRSNLIDITDRVKAEADREALHKEVSEERSRLRTILDTLPVGVIISDHAGKAIEVNRIAKTILGGRAPLPRDQESYAPLKSWWTDSGIPLASKDWGLARTMKKGEAVIGETIDIQRYDGTMGTVIISSALIKDAGGRMTGGVAIIQDITFQRLLEQEAVEAKERAQLYIDLLTHDIHNMNAAITGYLQLALDKMDIEKANMHYFTKPMEVLDNSNELIDHVRKIQMVDAHESRHGLVDLGWLLETVRSEFENYPGRKVKIEYRPSLKRFVVAPELIKEVFFNIIGNSIKHSKGAVDIDIALTKIYRDGREFYKVVIEDNGPGIPDEMKEVIFGRLQRGRTKTTGRGLGLYLAKRLVDDSRGEIWVEDRVPGDRTKGAKFVILLPVATQSNNAP